MKERIRHRGCTQKIYVKIVAIFLNNSNRSFTPTEISKKTNGNINTICSALRRFRERGIIRQLHTRRYILNDLNKALDYVEQNSANPLRVTPRDEKKYPIPIKEHHVLFKIKIRDDIFHRLQYKFSNPHPKDPARNRTFEGKSITITVSQATLNGTLYIKGAQWRAELRRYFGDELLQQCDEQERFIGKSIDAEYWANFRLSAKDLQLIFGASHFWKELDIEGKERLVNSLLQNIVRTSFEKTIYEALIFRLLEELVKRMDMLESNQNLYLKEIQDIFEKILKDYKRET